MERREFVTVAGTVLVSGRVRRWADVGAWHAMPLPPAHASQEPSLSPAVFAHRIERAQAELKTRKWDFLIATPSANYRYFTADNPGTSERLGFFGSLLAIGVHPRVVLADVDHVEVKGV